MRTIGLIATLGALLWTGRASAEPSTSEAPPAAREHHGLFARAELGEVVFAGVPTNSHTQAGAGFDLAVGGALNQRIVLYGEVFAYDQFALMSAHYGATGIGPGASVWLSHGIYVSASALWLRLAKSEWIPNDRGDSDREWVVLGRGLGASASIGKDWRSPKHPSLDVGLAVHAFAGRLRCTSACMNESDMPASAWTAKGGLVALALSFN